MKSLYCFLLIILTTFSVCAKELVFATYPSNSPENIYRAFTDLTSYLTNETGLKIKLVVTKDYAELAERIANGTVDIAWIGSVNYIKTKKKIPSIKYIATYSEKSDTQKNIVPYYQSYIITMKSYGFKSLSDIKGKMFAFVDKDSTSGYAYPNMMLKDNGIDPFKYFKKVFFLKKHDRVIEALVSGSIDAGAVSDGTYLNAVEKYGDMFTIIEKSAPIPLDAVIASPAVPNKTVEIIKTALIKIDENHYVNHSIETYLGWPSAGFTIKNDAFYDGLRKALGL